MALSAPAGVIPDHVPAGLVHEFAVETVPVRSKMPCWQ